MLIKRAPDIPSSEITDKRVYLDRRAFMRTAAVTADLEETLRRVRAYRETDPNFESAIAKFAESEARHGANDPVEGTEDHEARPAQRMVRQPIRG